jgi:hypothetical protein
MKTVSIGVLIVLTTALPAVAINRYNSERLTAKQIHHILSRQHAAIFRYRAPHTRGVTMFDRFVKNAFYCPNSDLTELVKVPARYGKFARVERCIIPNKGGAENTAPAPSPAPAPAPAPAPTPAPAPAPSPPAEG